MKKMKYFIVLVFTLFVIGLPNVIFSQPKEDLLMGYIDKIDEIHYDISESISQIYYSFLSVNCDNIYDYIKEIAALSDAYRKDVEYQPVTGNFLQADIIITIELLEEKIQNLNKFLNLINRSEIIATANELMATLQELKKYLEEHNKDYSR